MKRPIDWREDRSAVREKVAESARCVLPIVLIVVLLCLAAAPMKPDLLLSFLIGGVMLVVGMGLFSLGAEQSMTPIGSRIGTALTRTKNMPLILGVSFLLGFAITVAEPDLQVLAQTVPHIKSIVLLVTVGAGVGLFMAICMLRILTGASLRWILIVCYTLIFVLAAFTDRDFLCIAFDSGGVTTGPMTVPFILAMGLGVSKVRSDDRAEADIGLVERIIGDGRDLVHVDLALRREIGLVHADVHDLADEAAALRVIAHNTAGNGDGQLIDAGRVDEFGLRGMEAGAGELVRHLVAGHQPDIVAGDDLLRRAHADGERAAGQQVLHRAVRRADAERQLLIIADAAPGGVHGAGRAVLAIGSQNEHRLRINACMCAKILSHKEKHSF